MVGWYCLPDSPFLLCYNPETLSRVTLASLGIAFQANLIRSICWIRGRYYMGRKYQWIKTWGKMDNDIFFYCFFLLMFNIPSMLKSLRALSPTLKNETRIARIRRILSFHGFFIVFWILIGFSCAYRRWISSS